MKAHIRCKHATVEVEAETFKDLFGKAAAAKEIFSEESCGLCQSEDITPRRRVVTQGKKVFEYFEYICRACGGILDMGVHQEGGTLFPKRKLDKDGKPDSEKGTYDKRNRGWHKWSAQAIEGQE